MNDVADAQFVYQTPPSIHGIFWSTKAMLADAIGAAGIWTDRLLDECYQMPPGFMLFSMTINSSGGIGVSW